MRRTPPSHALSELAALLSVWVAPSELQADCSAWAAYWKGEGDKPGKGPANGVPLKDSDYHVFSEALACVKFGWERKADAHLERVNRRMKSTPVLTRFPLAARVGTPQPRAGKE